MPGTFHMAPARVEFDLGKRATMKGARENRTNPLLPWKSRGGCGDNVVPAVGSYVRLVEAKFVTHVDPDQAQTGQGEKVDELFDDAKADAGQFRDQIGAYQASDEESGKDRNFSHLDESVESGARERAAWRT